jgi:hypothetical protein
VGWRYSQLLVFGTTISDSKKKRKMKRVKVEPLYEDFFKPKMYRDKKRVVKEKRDHPKHTPYKRETNKVVVTEEDLPWNISSMDE